MNSYFKYWGKADDSYSGEPKWHPLVYHCLDVAAVCREYLLKNENLSEYFYTSLGCDKDAWLNWASFWTILHDLGKFSEAFQSQKPDLFFMMHGRKPCVEKRYTERHDSLGQWVWRDWLSEQAIQNHWFGDNTESESVMPGLDMWINATTGHHGQPPKVERFSGMSLEHFSSIDRKFIELFTDEIRDIFLTESTKSIPFISEPAKFEHVSQSLSWWFSGVVVLADWLGSNTTYFPYREANAALGDYWDVACEQAKMALKESGIIASSIKRNLSFKDLFPNIAIPSSLQLWAQSVNLSNGPQIYLLEDVTGSGKTEAAMMLAYRLMEAENAQGFFIGLPSMATANAMYERIANIYCRLFEGNANLVLSHGSRELVEKFAKTILPAVVAEKDNDQLDETASARCTAWLADHGKRALLAQAGVGTIDQVLLSVLHSKHQSLRLLGLYGKVLIIDEVHACDAYMQGVLEVLLEFHARAGGSAILLSATLPAHMKHSLLKAYARGCGVSCPAIQKDAYPLATWWQSHKPELLQEEPIVSRETMTRTVSLAHLDDETEVIIQIKNMLEQDKCVCWIRNTVTDAITAYEKMEKLVPKESITLFHARFTLSDRLEKENIILNNFGINSIYSKRKGKLVIATQVAEQSLDVDFDFMVSDLAPVDRLIQRAGRLHRHIRDSKGNRIADSNAADQREKPRMTIYGPAWEDEPKSDWFKKLFPKATFVYPDPSQMWLTASVLRCGEIAMPSAARNLIEGVFGENASIPEGLQKKKLTVQGEQMAEASLAKNNSLNFSAGYVRGDVMDWWGEGKTPSRLSRSSISIVLSCWRDGRLVPWANRAHAWAYSAVKIAEWWMAKPFLPTDNERLAEYQRTLETLPDKGRWSILLPLEKDQNGIWYAQAWTLGTAEKPAKLLKWQYNTNTGLQLVETNENTEG